jgi:hypothetical protein
VSGVTLQANCRKVDGTWDSTSIEISGIENINGVLKVTGASPSSYQKTCRDIGVNGDVLMATCQKVDGSWQGTSLEIPGIANINGVLKYQWCKLNCAVAAIAPASHEKARQLEFYSSASWSATF